MQLIGLLIVGFVAGWLAGKLTKGSGFGVIGDLVLGVIGAFVGAVLFRLAGLATYSPIGNIIMATVGAVVLVLLARTLRRV